MRSTSDSVSKQTTLLDGVGFGPSKWCVYGRGLNGSANKAMNSNIISNVKVHLKTLNGNVNIKKHESHGLLRARRN